MCAIFPASHIPRERGLVSALPLSDARVDDFARQRKMVLKTEVCRFSGLKIYPGHGMRLTKVDSQTYLFLNAKCKRLFNLRLRPAKLAWTTQYRKAHKKVRTETSVVAVVASVPRARVDRARSPLATPSLRRTRWRVAWAF